ncbi:MAG: hypothetical protein WCF04_00005 [Candidatus Nanopelagicales bacterium]
MRKPPTQPTALRAVKADHPKPPLDVGRPLEFHEWLVANIGGPKVPGFYVRRGELVRVPRIGQDGYVPLSDKSDDEDGPAQVRPANTATVRAVLARQFRTYRMVKDRKGENLTEQEVLPPEDPVALYVAGVAEAGTAAPRLDAVVHTPFLRPDGSIVTTGGYDPATRLLLLPPRDLHMPAVPERPSTRQVREAADRLLALVCDFPFVTEHDRANYIGTVLLGPLLRPIVKPPYPISALSAHMAGSGKTLLGDVGRELHGGVFRSEPSQRDDEVRKLITSLLMHTSAPIIVLDNLTGVFKSGQFAALATSSIWSDRPLGATAHVEAPNDRLWVLTGNNLCLGGDMPRRVPIWSRIDADCPDPHLRNGFTTPDLIGHVRTSRGPLLAAALTLVRAWIVAGSPLAGVQRHDSFGTWIRSVAGILGVVGIPGDFASAEVARESSPVGSEDDEAAVFLAALAARFPGGFLARDVVAALVETRERQRRNARAEAGDPWVHSASVAEADADLLDALPEELVGKFDNAGFGKSLGRWLASRVGQWKGGRVLRGYEEPHTKVKGFRVQGPKR